MLFRSDLPIGLVGLCMVYLHLPDYREKPDPLDTIGLLLFGSAVALLSFSNKKTFQALPIPNDLGG